MRSPIDVWKDWESATLDSNKVQDLTNATKHILAAYSRYDDVGKMFGIPAWVIGAIHYREASFNFTTWLANGDPLMRHGLPAATIHVPKGLGPAPNWEEASMLSLKQMKWHIGMNWDLVSALIHLEEYNGLGYFHHGVPSPYIWSGTSHYFSGKYTSDGHYDPSVHDKQLGCAAIAKALKAQGMDLNEKRYV